MFLFTLMKALYDEKCFLFHITNSFCSCNIYIFARAFWLYRKSVDKKAMLFSKFIMPWTVQLRITIHISLNISKSKGKQTMKFGQVIEYNMINIFLEKSYTKCAGEACPRPSYEKSKLSVYLDQQFEM